VLARAQQRQARGARDAAQRAAAPFHLSLSQLALTPTPSLMNIFTLILLV
jgi:hypothetical protein